MLTISSVCFIGKTGKPLFFRTYTCTSAASLQLATYAALDALEAACHESTNLPAETSADPYKGYLGPATGMPSLLTLAVVNNNNSTVDRLPKDLACFGYVSSSGLKIIVIVEDWSTFTDPDLRPLFRQLHQAYADALTNPFMAETLASTAFVSSVDHIVATS